MDGFDSVSTVLGGVEIVVGVGVIVLALSVKDAALLEDAVEPPDLLGNMSFPLGGGDGAFLRPPSDDDAVGLLAFAAGINILGVAPFRDRPDLGAAFGLTGVPDAAGSLLGKVFAAVAGFVVALVLVAAGVCLEGDGVLYKLFMAPNMLLVSPNMPLTLGVLGFAAARGGVLGRALGAAAEAGGLAACVSPSSCS